MSKDRITQFDEDLRVASIPVEGVSDDGKGNGSASVTIRFLSEATQPQKDAAATMRDAFDWRRRKPKAMTALRTEITNLDATTWKKLQVAMSADFLRRHPDFAQKLGINIDGDEPE